MAHQLKQQMQPKCFKNEQLFESKVSDVIHVIHIVIERLSCMHLGYHHLKLFFVTC